MNNKNKKGTLINKANLFVNLAHQMEICSSVN